METIAFFKNNIVIGFIKIIILDLSLSVDEDRSCKTTGWIEEFCRRLYCCSGHPKLERRLEVGALGGHVGGKEGELHDVNFNLIKA